MPNPLRKLRIGKGKNAVTPASEPSSEGLAALAVAGLGSFSTVGPSTATPAPASSSELEGLAALAVAGTVRDTPAPEPNTTTTAQEPNPVESTARRIALGYPTHSSEPPLRHESIASSSLAVEEGVPAENFGLFEFPPRPSASLSTASSVERHAPIDEGSVSSVERHTDIIAVHGLGGHWLKTWRASDGAVWFRDRVPAILAEANISCRIRSFGYNSAFAFTKGETNIAGSAKDLIDRIQLLRGKDSTRFRPIIFVAHSLGSIVVKEALNIEWTKNRLYEDILDNVKGCIFMGVPHHGAGIAKWAKHATQLVKIASLGFNGNTNFVKALERGSPEWVRISRDFVERGRQLSIGNFYETERTSGVFVSHPTLARDAVAYPDFMQVVDEASAALHIPQEQSFALPGSDHRTVCRFSDSENERFSLVGKAVLDIARVAHEGKMFRMSMCILRMLILILSQADRLAQKARMPNSPRGASSSASLLL